MMAWTPGGNTVCSRITISLKPSSNRAEVETTPITIRSIGIDARNMLTPQPALARCNRETRASPRGTGGSRIHHSSFQIAAFPAAKSSLPF